MRGERARVGDRTGSLRGPDVRNGVRVSSGRAREEERSDGRVRARTPLIGPGVRPSTSLPRNPKGYRYDSTHHLALPLGTHFSASASAACAASVSFATTACALLVSPLFEKHLKESLLLLSSLHVSVIKPLFDFAVGDTKLESKLPLPLLTALARGNLATLEDLLELLPSLARQRTASLAHSPEVHVNLV